MFLTRRQHTLSSGKRRPGRRRYNERTYLDSSLRLRYRLGLFQVGSQGVDQVVGRLGLLICGCLLRIKNVKADVSLDHLGHKGVHSTPASGDVMQHLGAFGLLVECLFDGLNLPSDSSYAIE